MTFDDILRSALGQGFALPRALEFLRASGASPAEAANAVRGVTGADAAAARDVVAQSRAWDGPRSGAQLQGTARQWYGSPGQSGRSGRGASSVLPHLARESQVAAAARR